MHGEKIHAYGMHIIKRFRPYCPLAVYTPGIQLISQLCQRRVVDGYLKKKMAQGELSKKYKEFINLLGEVEI